MNRRSFLKIAAGASLLAAPAVLRGRYQLFANSTREYSARAIDLVRRSLVIDMLNPFTLNAKRESEWLSNPELFGPKDLQRFKNSGIRIFNLGGGGGGRNAHVRNVKFLADWNGFIASHTDDFMRIDSSADFQRLERSGKLGILLGVQNSDHFQTLDDVNYFHGLGLRVSQLTYNSRNLIGSGATERRDDGLSNFGLEIVSKMQEVGIAVDVSHCGDRTTLDACEAATRPLLITHSNARALVPEHPRCKTDEAIKRMAKTGGVIGITGMRMFVRNQEPTTLEHVLDHFDHVKKLVGVEHVGVGSDSDLDGYDVLPAETLARMRSGYTGNYALRDKLDIEGLNHPKRMFDLTEGLIKRKYTDPEIELILSGNFRRALVQIWQKPQ